MNEQGSRDRLRWKIKTQKRRQYHFGDRADARDTHPEFRKMKPWIKAEVGVWWEGGSYRRQVQTPYLRRFLHRMEASSTPTLHPGSVWAASFLSWKSHIWISRLSAMSSNIRLERDQCLISTLWPRVLWFPFSLPEFHSALLFPPFFHWFSPDCFHSFLWNAPSFLITVRYNQHFNPLSLTCEYFAVDITMNSSVNIEGPWKESDRAGAWQERDHGGAIRTFLGTKLWWAQEFLTSPEAKSR